MSEIGFTNLRGDKEWKEIKKNGKVFSLVKQGPYQGSAYGFQRQTDGKGPGFLCTVFEDMEERTEEDGVKKEERMQGGVVISEEIFFLIRNLQDADGKETASDGGWWGEW